jgi:hypothetical protein
MSSFPQRVIRAAKLDVSLYEEVEADSGATVQALLVVVLSNVAMALGTWGASTGGNFLQPLIGALVSWVMFAVAVYLVGAKLLKEPQTSADVPQLLRTIGFASAPGILNVLGLFPFLIVVIAPITGIWMLVATVLAVRQALDFRSTPRAVIVCLIGAIVFAGVRSLLWLATGGGI